nr:uncharacterized protein LOC121116268 [Lepeophtheirus salmonis]
MAILNGTSLFFERSSKVDFILPYRTLGLLFLLVLLLPYSSQKLSTSSSKSYSSLSSETEYFTQHNNISSPLEFRHHHSFITVPNASSSASSYSTSWEWTRLQRRHYRSSSLSSSSRTLIDDGQSDGSGSERKPSRHSQCLYSRFRSKSHSPGYTTTFIHNNNASLSTSKNQLSKLQRVTNWINRLCSTPDPKDRLEKLLSNSPCSEYKLDICQALTPKDILDIVGSDHFACFKTVEKWWKTFHHIRNLLDDFNLFLPSFDSSPYSVEFELDQCKGLGPLKSYKKSLSDPQDHLYIQASFIEKSKTYKSSK